MAEKTFVIQDRETAKAILETLLGKTDASAEMRQHDQDARAKLRALGWSENDLCALGNAQAYTAKFQDSAMILAHLGNVDHGMLEAAKVALAMTDLALKLSEKVDAAFASIGWPTRPADQYRIMRECRDVILANIAKLEAEPYLDAALTFAQALASSRP